MPIITEMYEDAGDFMGLRQEFRKRNLERVRREFGLPVPEIVEGRAIYKDTEGGEHPWHQSMRKEAQLHDVEGGWGSEVTIVPLPVSADGTYIRIESKDLDRDIEGLMKAETVDHGIKPNPGFVLDSLDDDAVDLRLQEWIKSHE